VVLELSGMIEPVARNSAKSREERWNLMGKKGKEIPTLTLSPSSNPAFLRLLHWLLSKTTANESQHYAGDNNAHDTEEESYQTSRN
jgi:hypothetical protein